MIEFIQVVLNMNSLNSDSLKDVQMTEVCKINVKYERISIRTIFQVNTIRYSMPLGQINL